ncbi:Solute carrier family 25 member 44 [Linum perenne]
MSLSAAEEDSASEIHIPAEIDWQMLDKSRFFFLGAALFSGVSAALYPAVVLKTRLQVIPTQISSLNLSLSIMRHEGLRGFYRGFGFSLMGTVPARALYMSALELTKSSVGTTTISLGFSDTSAVAIANAAAGMTSAMAAQLVWTPIDVVSQRLMVQGCGGKTNSYRYLNGIDACRKILYTDGLRGLYRGFGISILTYAPSNAVWWASYSVAHRFVWSCLNSSSSSSCKEKRYDRVCGATGCGFNRNDSMTMFGVQGLCAAMASGASAVVTMPIDTIKTRLQVLDGEQCGRRKPLTVMETVRNLMNEGGFAACYKGLGPRWVSMSMSAATMITTYEFLKRLSTKSKESLD